MSFQALSCKGGALISICTFQAMVFRILIWHLFGSATVIMLPCISLMVVLVYSLIHTFSVLYLQLKKLRRYNKSVINLSNANPDRGHQELRRSTGHINGESPLLKTSRDSMRDKIYARYNQRRTPETYRRQNDVFVWVRGTVCTVWGAASVSESESQATEKAI